jgi:hypothetical protein
MKSKLLIVLVGVGALVGWSVGVQAQPINGDIDFSGFATLNTGIASATAYTSIYDVTVDPSGNSGSFTGFNTTLTPHTATFNTFSFGGNTLNPNPLTLWTATDGSGNVWKLIATSVTITLQNGTFLDLSGNGTIYENGGDATSGVWTMDDTSASGLATVTFGSSSQATVPDGGTTVLLLGAALTGLAVIKRYLS